jgi:flagellar biosynthesis protein
MSKDRTSEPRGTVPVAVAVKYQGNADPAPRVTASGRGDIAAQIVAVARAEGVEVHEDADLAEILVTLDVDSFIPIEAFTAVAEILSYVYRKNGTDPRRSAT